MQTNYKRHKLSNNANKLINAEVELSHRPRTWRIQSIYGAVPVRCTVVVGFRDQRNRRNTKIGNGKSATWSLVRQSGVGWRAQFLFAGSCLGVPGGAPFSQLNKGDRQLVFYIQWFSDTFYPLVADIRATVRTTETLSHAAFRKKNGC